MRTARNFNRAGDSAAPSVTIHGVEFALDRSTLTPVYRARVEDAAFAEFLASTGVNEPVPVSPHASVDVSLTPRATSDVKAFHADDAWALSILPRRVEVLESEFGIDFKRGVELLPEFAG